MFMDTWAKMGTRIRFVLTYRKAKVKPIAEYSRRCSGSPCAIANIRELIKPAIKKFHRLYNTPKMIFRKIISSKIGPIMEVTMITMGAVFIRSTICFVFSEPKSMPIQYSIFAATVWAKKDRKMPPILQKTDSRGARASFPRTGLYHS